MRASDHENLHAMLEYVANHLGVILEQKNHWYVGLCPLHGENTPSFYIDNDGHAHCFGGCPKPNNHWGDVVDLIRAVEFPTDATFARAFQKARALGLYREDLAVPLTGRIRRKSEPPTRVQQRAMELLYRFSHEMLWSAQGAPAHAYLKEWRGLKGPYYTSALHWVGYLPWNGWIDRYLKRLRETVTPHANTVAKEIGVLRKDGTPAIHNRLLFASRDLEGRVAFFQTRSIAHHTDKRYAYLNTPFPKLPFVPLAWEASLLPGTRVIEGPLDALAFGICGLFSGATLGEDTLDMGWLARWPDPWFLYQDQKGNQGDAAAESQRSHLRLQAFHANIRTRDPWYPTDLKDGDPAGWLSERGSDHLYREQERLCQAIA